MASPRHPRPPSGGFGRVPSMASSTSSGRRGHSGPLRSSTMSTVSDSIYAVSETSRSHFQAQLHEIATALGVPLALPRPLLSLPNQRAATFNASDKTGAGEFLMTLRPKRTLIGRSSRDFTRDEALLALDKVLAGQKPNVIVEGLLQIAETGGSSNTKEKRGQTIPTLDDLFTKAAQSRSLDIWRLFLGRASQRSLDASLAATLRDRPDDIVRIRALLEYGANPELCQDQTFDLISSGSEELVELLLLSPLVTNVEFLSHGLLKAASGSSLRNTCMLLLRGADANFSHANALKAAISSKKYAFALAIVTLAKNPVSSSHLDDATGLIGSWTHENQKSFLKLLLYGGASGPRMSKALVPFITTQELDIISILTECSAFQHSTFPAPRLFQFAIDTRNFTLALDVLRSSNNRSFADYVNNGVHLKLVKDYPSDAEATHPIISELLTLGLGVSGEYASQMLVECCSSEQMESPNMMTLINLLITTAGAKASYSEGAALLLAIDAASPAVVGLLMTAKPTKKILNTAVSHTSLGLVDSDPAKLEIWSILLDAGASGQAVDHELAFAIDKGSQNLQKVKVLLTKASLEYAEGKAIVRAVQFQRLDILEIMLAQSPPPPQTFISIWNQVRKLFALAESKDGHLPYRLPYMQKIFEILYGCAKSAIPANDLLLDATQCGSTEVALGLTKLLLRWGASPNHGLGTPLQYCIRRSDPKTLAALLSVETFKPSLKYAFQEALLLRNKTRHVILEMLIGAGLEKASLDAALPKVLKEDRYAGPVVQLLVGRGAKLDSSVAENLVPPALNLDLPVVERLLSTVDDKDSILQPLKAVLSSRTDWQKLDGESVPMVKLLVKNCRAGTWADGSFIAGVKARNRHWARLFANHLTSNKLYSDALQELLAHDTAPLDRDSLSVVQSLLKNGAKGNVIDETFVRAAQTLNLEWVNALYQYISDRSVALSAFEIVLGDKEAVVALQGVRLEVIQFLLQKGLNGPIVDQAFVQAASVGDVKGMNNFLAYVSSDDAFSDSLGLIAQKEDLLTSGEGSSAIKLLLSKSVSDVAVGNVARAAAKAHSLAGVKLITGLSQGSLAKHAAFQGLMNHSEPLSSPDSRAILSHLLENGLSKDDVEHVARLSASSYDVGVVKALAPYKNSYLHDIAIGAVDLVGDTWLSPKGLDFVNYLLSKGISGPSIHKLIEGATKAFNVPALQLILPACDDKSKAVEIAFSSLVSDNERWTSVEGLHVTRYLLGEGAKGLAVEEAASYAAKVSQYDALDVFLESPAVAIAIPAAFKALTRQKPGQLSSEQLAIASTLVKSGVSTEVLAVAAVEMAKILDIEGLKVLSQSPRFRQVADDVLRAMLLDEELWRVPNGLRITQFLMENGTSSKIVEVAVSKATTVLDIDALRNVLDLNNSASVVTAAFTSMTGLGKAWLCPEGLRITNDLLDREPSPANVNKAFIQASQYLHFDAVQLLRPHVTEPSVFSEALSRAASTKSEWLSALRLVKFLLDAGADGDAVESTLIKGAQALDLASAKMLAAKVDRPEVYSKALAAATEGKIEWLRSLDLIEFLLDHGANGEPVDKAYLAASKALDLEAVTLLKPHIANPDSHTHAFRAASSNQTWLSPIHLPLLKFLHTDNVARDAVEIALISAAEAHNVPVVEILSQNANEDMCAKAFTAATRNANTWTSEDGSKVVHILAKKGARGDSVDDALINSARLFRLDLVSFLTDNIDKDNFGTVSLALDALLATDGQDTSSIGGGWLFNSDAHNILQMLVDLGANGDSAHAGLVKAAQFGDKAAVNILAQVVDEPSTFTKAFDTMTSSSTLWLDSDNFLLVATLLQRGSADESVHFALVTAVSHAIDGVASPELLALLLQHGADVNYGHGKALQLANRNARQDIFEMLLQKDPDPCSLYMSLQAALTSRHDEEKVFCLFKAVSENECIPQKPDVNNNSDLGLPLLFYCLNNYPTSARLVKEVCDLGADLSATIGWEMFVKGVPISDQLSPLLVALEKDCSDDVITILLQYSAKVNFIADRSRACALILAAGRGRASIVSTLIDRGASVIHKDANDRTPLCYAARNGDIPAMNSILKKNPPRNDGSLHEAARELHADAVKLLVKSGHSIHVPSLRFGGNNPLCELCASCKGSKDPVELDETLNELLKAKAEPLAKCCGRTAFFMAMENANPCPVVTALIQVFSWKDLNDPQNVYEEGDYFYSPTMYIKKGIIQQPETVANEVLAILKLFSAEDRYYAKERMQQPKDAVGMPQRLLDLDHKKWIRSSRIEEQEEDFARRLRMQDQEVANRQLLSQRQHLLLMEQREDLGHQQSSHVLDAHILTTKLRDREHGITLMHQEELFDRRLGEMAAANVMKVNIEAAQHGTKFGFQQQSREAQLEHESRTQEQKINYLGQEQEVRYTGLEAQQNLRLGGIENELEMRHQQEINELRFQEARSGVNRGDLDHRLQYTNEMNTGRVQMTHQLADIEMNSRQKRNVLEDQNRQGQLQYQSSADERMINTQGEMNQHEFARNQDRLNTHRTQGQIEMDTRAGLGQIEQNTMYNKLQMTQQDRSHQLETEHRMGQIQNQNLSDKFDLTQYDRAHQVATERRMGQVQQQNLEEKLSTNLNYLQHTHREKLGFQQATDQQKLGFQQRSDLQMLDTLHTRGRIENDTQQQRHHIDFDYQRATDYQNLKTLHTAGRIENHSRMDRNNIDFHQQTRSGNQQIEQQGQANYLEMQKDGFRHENRMGELSAQDMLNTRQVQGAYVTRQMQNGNMANMANMDPRMIE
ncbi:uncharacterized protein PAC_05817 [Phialocephala subalpina]|uniref:Uncharacterized protein n=1 Tax=Phialocephala subalpina TaxID=576137 RepID=A0A1L7WT27_9HELO|nr:uncharacterized protein PAC_05817 [Phialocephala subalpina]